MIKLYTVGHNDLCGGYCYSGTASFEGTTVAEVLEEIKEFVKDKASLYIGDGFGRDKDGFGCCWGIRINDVRYVGGWNGWKNEYRHEYDEEKVVEIRVSGGWYCFYDFDIISEKTKKSAKKILENKLADKEVAELEEKEALKMFGL